MQHVCVLFAGRRGLDDSRIRQSVLRIPEVSRKLKKVQAHVDSLLGEQRSLDLISHTLSPDEEFSARPELRALIAGSVQVGLFDRFTRFHSRPQFLVGCINGASPLRVCSQEDNLEEFVLRSELFKSRETKGPIPTQLTGLSLEEFAIYSWNDQSSQYERVDTRSKDAIYIIDNLSQENKINQCIHVGPCCDFLRQDFADKGLVEVPAMSSIEMDPILNSFWKSA